MAIYTIASIMLTLFYAWAFTQRICFGSRLDKEFTKGKKAYYGIYAFMLLLFTVFFLCGGAKLGFAPKTDYVIKTCELYVGLNPYSFFSAKMVCFEKDKHDDLEKAYYTKRNEDIRTAAIRMVERNSSIILFHDLQDIQVVYEADNLYSICANGGEVYASLEIEYQGPIKKFVIYWDLEQLERVKMVVYDKEGNKKRKYEE